MKDFIKLQIRSIIDETDDCKTYVFNAPELIYKAGQFLTFILNTGNHTIRRAYSFSSSPEFDQYPSVTIKHIENGEGSRHIFNYWKVGGHVEALQPFGRFTLPTPMPKEIILIAAGSGIGPIYSLLKSALILNSTINIHLFYSNKSRDKTIFLNELIELELKYPDKLKIAWFFSDNFNIIDARINADFIDKYFQTKINNHISNVHVFACGPENFMYLSEVNSKYAGVLPQNYHQEIFYKPESESIVKHQYAEGEFDVTFELKSGTYQIKIAGNKTILSEAIHNKIPLNWSCAAGRCSTCTLHLKSGKVYLSRNEVLTDNDLEQGYMLTCTGYPLEGTIVMEERK